MSPEERLVRLNFIDMPNLFHLKRVWWDIKQINHVIKTRFENNAKYRYGDIPREYIEDLLDPITIKKYRYFKNSYGYKKWKKSSKEYKIKSLKCRAMTRKRIQSGKIIKTRCCVCGKETVDTHHTNYDSPFSVIFLCREHHIELHNKIGFINFLIETL